MFVVTVNSDIMLLSILTFVRVAAAMAEVALEEIPPAAATVFSLSITYKFVLFFIVGICGT